MKKTLIVMLMLCLLTACLAGCQKKADPAEKKEAAPAVIVLEDLSGAEAKARALRESLEKDALTQAEMNEKSAELYALWEAEMNRLLEAAQKKLSAAELEALSAEQAAWLETRTQAAEAAGAEFAGGSMYTLVVNMEAAALTEARVYALYEMLK